MWEGVDLSTTLSRSRFEGLVSQTLAQIVQPLKDLLQKCNLENSQITKVSPIKVYNNRITIGDCLDGHIIQNVY